MGEVLVHPDESLGASLANFHTLVLVQHHVTKDGELLVTPRSRALDSFLPDIMDQFYMTPEIASVPGRQNRMKNSRIHYQPT